MTDSKRKTVINLKSSSKANKHYSIVRFPEPDIVDEIFDIKINGIDYRVFTNRKLNRLICNEIVSYDYKGIVLLKNPVDMKLSRLLEKVFFEANPPKNKRLDTIAHFRKKIEKFNKQENLTAQSRKQSVGRRRSLVIAKATLWCIKSHSKHILSKAEILRRACGKFKGKTHSEESFVKMLTREWNRLIRQYGKPPKQIKDEKSLYIYAKSELKISRKVTKQKTNGD